MTSTNQTHSYPGRLICFEGIDGSGKSHFCTKLSEHLTAQGLKTLVTHEPGGTAVAEKIGDILLHFKDEALEKIMDETELLLFFAARCQHINNLIIPKLQEGYWLLSDRFTPSSYAYQGAGRGLGWDKVQALENYLPPLNPDLLLLLDLDISQSSQRWQAQATRDRFEKMLQKNGDFFASVRQGYLQYAKKYPSTKVLDASLPEDEVWALIKKEVAKLS
ncbi:MAG: dTMP kinase [Candidatus Portiera sp.]|nr:dTMP kinase [Portiera sp.]